MAKDVLDTNVGITVHEQFNGNGYEAVCRVTGFDAENRRTPAIARAACRRNRKVSVLGQPQEYIDEVRLLLAGPEMVADSTRCVIA